MFDEKIIANGVNGLTGEYLLPPLDPAEVADTGQGAAGGSCSGRRSSVSCTLR